MNPTTTTVPEVTNVPEVERKETSFWDVTGTVVTSGFVVVVVGFIVLLLMDNVFYHF